MRFRFFEQIQGAPLYGGTPYARTEKRKAPAPFKLSGALSDTAFRTRGCIPCAALRPSSLGKRRDHESHALCLFYFLTTMPERAVSSFSAKTPTMEHCFLFPLPQNPMEKPADRKKKISAASWLGCRCHIVEGICFIIYITAICIYCCSLCDIAVGQVIRVTDEDKIIAVFNPRQDSLRLDTPHRIGISALTDNPRSGISKRFFIGRIRRIGFSCWQIGDMNHNCSDAVLGIHGACSSSGI